MKEILIACQGLWPYCQFLYLNFFFAIWCFLFTENPEIGCISAVGALYPLCNTKFVHFNGMKRSGGDLFSEVELNAPQRIYCGEWQRTKREHVIRRTNDRLLKFV